MIEGAVLSQAEPTIDVQAKINVNNNNASGSQSNSNKNTVKGYFVQYRHSKTYDGQISVEIKDSENEGRNKHKSRSSRYSCFSFLFGKAKGAK